MALSIKYFSSHLTFTRFRCLLGPLLVKRHYSSELFGEEEHEKKVKKHRETTQFPNEFSPEKPKGKIYDKKPFCIELKQGRTYSWCACGHSHTQPLCDGSHKTLWGTAEKKTMPKWGPHRFQVEKTKNYWLCNCKQTDNRPFCDGTHKLPDIQAAIK